MKNNSLGIVYTTNYSLATNTFRFQDIPKNLVIVDSNGEIVELNELSIANFEINDI